LEKEVAPSPEEQKALEESQQRLIAAAIGVSLVILIYALRAIAFPSQDWLLKQYREAYESLLCPICSYPIRRGPLKYMIWTRRSLRRLTAPPRPTPTTKKRTPAPPAPRHSTKPARPATPSVTRCCPPAKNAARSSRCHRDQTK
jgi:hypothetical protein